MERTFIIKFGLFVYFLSLMGEDLINRKTSMREMKASSTMVIDLGEEGPVNPAHHINQILICTILGPILQVGCRVSYDLEISMT